MKRLVFQVRDIKALIVDDNAVNLMVASNVLAQYGIVADEADSGGAAVKKCLSQTYDFVFMDYLMPDMNGAEAIKSILSQNGKKGAVIIGLSANIDKELADEFEAAGADYVMAKPLELKELNQVLRRHIPEEKIAKEGTALLELEEAGGKARTEPSAVNEGILSVLSKTEGLNVEKGLINVMGAVVTYVRVLHVCCANITEQIDYIKAGYNLIATSDLEIYFHSIKGILANIGAEGLSELSNKMEIAAHCQDEAYINEKEASYIEQVESFRDRLKQAVRQCKKRMDEGAMDNYKPMGAEEYVQKLGLLKECIRLFEFNEINDLMEEMLAASQGEKRKKMKAAYDAIQQFQYEEAMELVAALLEQELNPA